MAKLYIVGFNKKKLAIATIVDTKSETIGQSLKYGGSATFSMYGDHGCVMDRYFKVIMTWDGNGDHYTPYFKHKYE